MPGTDAIRIGDVDVVPLVDGVADLSTPIVEAFPVAPADAILADRDRYPDLYGPGDTWRITVRTWLLRSPTGIVLMDTGVGPETSAAMAWFPEPGRLHDALAAAGVAAADVGVVAISHVHDDHVGGAVGPAGSPAFPNARYLLQRSDLEALETRAAEDEEERTVLEQMIRPVRDAGQLDLLDGDHRLSPELELRLAPGHTPGHQVLHVVAGHERLLLSADTWNHPSQFGHPEWASATDLDRDRASATRTALLAELREHPSTLCAPTHLSDAVGHVRVGADGLAMWEPVLP